VSSPHRIVVGVDGSDRSARALKWAAQQADLTGTSLEIVTAWNRPPRLGKGMPLAIDYDPARNAKRIVNEVVDEVRHTHPNLRIESKIVGGHSSPALIEASQGADLLVVGSRGHSEFVGILLGSISEHCVTNAHCPVVVIRESNPRSEGPSALASECRWPNDEPTNIPK
jgi:nucleotide-binding universal stress UspA family protein